MEKPWTPVFEKNLQAYQKRSRLIVNSGGQGSGKTFAILQVLYGIARSSEVPKRITVASYALPHLKMGAMNDFEKILNFFQVDIDSIKNKTESTYKINKTLIEFIGIEGAEAKGHGTRRDILYVNEANQRVSYKTFDQLNTRTTECTFIDFNPCASFWFHELIEPNFEHTFIHSTFRDNPLLSAVERANIESKQDKPEFAAWFRVYGDGLLGRFEGAIFQNWRTGDFDESVSTVCGLDFGYTDQDALVRVGVDTKKKIIYCDELIYQSQLSTDELIQRMSQGVHKGELIIADSAQRTSIADLRKKFHIRGAAKGPHSLKNGIKKMLAYEIVITERSRNLSHELKNYEWLDKKTTTPVKGADHLIDAVRYAFMAITTPQPRMRVVDPTEYDGRIADYIRL